ncbi:MAG: hypothetical protein ACYC7D_15510 [Nitrososphaerales archaeon]
MSELSDLLKEIRSIRTSVDKVENIVEKRLIGVDTPSKDEAEAIKEYDRLKGRNATEYVPLEDALKTLGRVQGTPRKARR